MVWSGLGIGLVWIRAWSGLELGLVRFDFFWNSALDFEIKCVHVLLLMR
jgi:hypothetical protein